MTANGPKRDLPYVLSTVLWYREIKRLSACKSDYELELMIEPNACRSPWMGGDSDACHLRQKGDRAGSHDLETTVPLAFSNQRGKDY